MKESFIDSRSGHSIPVEIHLPSGPTKAVCLIIHGVVEHGARYRHVAQAFNDEGIAVYIPDHRGHGKTQKNSVPGVFAKKNGWMTVVADIEDIVQEIRNKFQGKPLILMGHSMGSLLVRTAAAVMKDKPQLIVLTGTPADIGSVSAVIFGLVLKIRNFICRPFSPSPLFMNLLFGPNTKRIPKPCSRLAWLSVNEENIQAYKADPLCGFHASGSLFADLFFGSLWCAKKKNILYLQGSVKAAFFSGSEDPVGNYGTGVKKTVKKFRDLGVEVVCEKYYPLLRHEILNETQKDAIIKDILICIKANIDME